MNKIKFATIIAVLFAAMFNASAQSDKVTLLQGTLYNSSTKEPVQTMLHFIDEDGKEIDAGSGINGQYQVVLTSGKSYVITAQNYLIDSEESDIDIPAGNTYKEMRQNLQLRKIEPGMELFAVSAFDSGKEVLNADGLAQILKLKSFLAQNLKVKVKIYFSAEDTYLKVKKEKVTEKVGKKKKTKTVTRSVAEQLEKLIENRKSNLRDVLTSLKIRENRYTFEPLAVSAEKPIKTKKASKKSKKSSKKDSSIKLITLKIEIESLMKM